MADLSTRSMAGVGLMVLGTAMFSVGLVPTLSTLSGLLVIAATLFTLGTYLVGTDVPGQVV